MVKSILYLLLILVDGEHGAEGESQHQQAAHHHHQPPLHHRPLGPPGQLQVGTRYSPHFHRVQCKYILSTQRPNCN